MRSILCALCVSVVLISFVLVSDAQLSPKRVSPISSVAFSPDGNTLAAARHDAVLLVDAATGKTKEHWKADGVIVNSVTFSPDGNWLIAGGGLPRRHGEVRVWSTESKRPIQNARAHKDSILGIVMSPHSTHIAAASYDNMLSLWTLGGPQPGLRDPQTLKDHTDAVYAVAFGLEGRLIASASGDRTIKVWQVPTGKRLYTLSEPTAEQYAVAFSNDGEHLAAGGVDRTVRLWKVDATAGTLIASAFAHDGAIIRLLFAPDGKTLITAAEDNLIKFWDIDGLLEKHVLEKQSDWPMGVALSPDGKRLAVGRYDGTMAMYDTTTFKRIWSKTGVIEEAVATRSKGKAAKGKAKSKAGVTTRASQRIGRAMRRRTEVSIKGDAFLINGKPTYAGRTWNGYKIEGLLMNSRMVQGIFDDMNPETRPQWAYPDTGQYDAERNTREFLAAMPEWRRHGLLAFTINLQGGNPRGYGRTQPWHNSAFTDDGELRPEYMNRLERILNRADELGMVVILGIFYFGQDQRLKDEATVIHALDNALNWVFDCDYRNVLIEINNECNVRYDHPILQPERVHELIEHAKMRRRSGRRFLVSTSYGGGTIPKENVVRSADFLLIHGNGVTDPNRIAEMVRLTRKVPGYRAMPILFNEDDHFDFDKPWNNMIAALSEYCSWGYFDPGKNNHVDGYQSPPVHWGINTDLKRGFFDRLKEVTGMR